MDIEYELRGIRFRWNADKAESQEWDSYET